MCVESWVEGDDGCGGKRKIGSENNKMKNHEPLVESVENVDSNGKVRLV